MSVPQQAKQYKIRGRQYRTNGTQLMRFHAGASTCRNNTAFHCNNRLPLLFIRDCLSPIVSFLSRHAVSRTNSDTYYFVPHRSKALPEWHRIGRVTFMFARQTPLSDPPKPHSFNFIYPFIPTCHIPLYCSGVPFFS